jgi:outer membrane protein assembly factor BamB
MRGEWAWALAALAVGCAVRGEDMSEWRGPARSGMLGGSPRLLDALPAGGIPKAWAIAVPGGDGGNYSTPVGASDRAFVHVSWRKSRPIEERRLDRAAVRRLGEVPKNLPAALAAKIEAARLSAERRALAPAGLDGWVKSRVEAELSEEERKAFGKFAESRLRAGTNAVGAEAMAKIAAVEGRAFTNEAAMVRWLEAELPHAADRAAVSKIVARETAYREDVLLCVRLDNGEPVWKRGTTTVNSQRGANNTPCVRDGRVYFVGCGGAVYCLNAADGEEIWREPTAGRGAEDGSVTVADGKLILQGGGGVGVVALDAATGKLAWRNPAVTGDSNSPAVWRHAGKTYVIAAGPAIACLDAADGKMLWKVGGGKWTTPAVAGDTMAVMLAEKGFSLFRLALDGAVQVVTRPLTFRSCSPMTDGERAYVLARQTGWCFDAKTGAVLWEGFGNNDTYASPLAADGKLIGNHRQGIVVSEAATGKELYRASMKFGECVSCALVNGRLLARSDTELQCYDLRQRVP